ncbi:hypothetical protein OTU49_008254 [Cherax quadricarinatus]|uniref:Uncharacterized protein n=1 Tax=Cherax quadricarinatus TaxID=27406 RepID=A0AAW0WC60_CHEQU
MSSSSSSTLNHEARPSTRKRKETSSSSSSPLESDTPLKRKCIESISSLLSWLQEPERTSPKRMRNESTSSSSSSLQDSYILQFIDTISKVSHFHTKQLLMLRLIE